MLLANAFLYLYRGSLALATTPNLIVTGIVAAKLGRRPTASLRDSAPDADFANQGQHAERYSKRDTQKHNLFYEGHSIEIMSERVRISFHLPMINHLPYPQLRVSVLGWARCSV